MDKKTWLEISLVVDGEMAEAISSVLADHVENGVVTEIPVVFNEEHEKYLPAGDVKVIGYIPVDSLLEEKKQRILESLWHLGQIRELPEPVFRVIDEENWMEAWKEHYHPIRIGSRIMVLPAWIKDEDPDRISIRIDPSMAFGTGTHPSTQMSLSLIEKYMQPGWNVMDIGCGSGILSIGAAKLGASKVLMLDIDQDSIKGSRENAQLNHVEEIMELHLGSLEGIRSGKFSIRLAPLVVANILASVLIGFLKEGLAEVVSPGGVLILAGILEEQAGMIRQAAAGVDLIELEMIQQKDWVAFAFQRNTP